MSNRIHILPPQVANQIAAGEVVERPASAVKELMENSIDAAATRIGVRIFGAGKQRIEIEDDGFGMGSADAILALQRHATSKIEQSEDLHCIATHGFRGEALPSIASVSRFRLTTALAGEAEGVEIRVDGGGLSESRPAPARKGTKIEILDLFLNTPARLHFMRTDKTEEAAIVEVFRGLALAHPKVAMRLEFDGRTRFDFFAQEPAQRVFAIMGDDFAQNCKFEHLQFDGLELSAYLGLPTYHHRDANRMVFLVNGRVIRDKQLIAALRAGYRDVMFHDRYPVAVVRLEIDPALVDVNVHPAKREVRFSDPKMVFSAIVATVRKGITSMGQTVADTTTEQALKAMHQAAEPTASNHPIPHFVSERSPGFTYARNLPTSHRAMPADIQRHLFSAQVAEDHTQYSNIPLDLGQPLAQIHQCYVLAQTHDGVVLVDQHAAHERMTYEKLKSQLAGHHIACQMLLTPELVSLQSDEIAWLYDYADALEKFGVHVRVEHENNVWVEGVPAMLAKEPIADMVAELIAACMLLGVETEADNTGLGRVLERWLGNRACKGSIKAGKVLSAEQQLSLLREMEKTPNIAQCNHGRPTYVRLSLYDMDKLFGRKE